MRHIPSITMLFWGLTIVFYIYFREIFLRPEIKFPFVILLTIFLTVSFWNLQKAGNKLYSLLFIGLFSFNTGIIVYGIVYNHNSLMLLESASENRLDPDMAKLLVTADNALERETAARIIYQRHGIALPFRHGEDVFTLYTPSKNDRDAFVASQERYFLRDRYKNNLSQQTIPLLFLLLLQILIFSGLLVFLLLTDQEDTVKGEA